MLKQKLPQEKNKILLVEVFKIPKLLKLHQIIKNNYIIISYNNNSNKNNNNNKNLVVG